MIDFHTTLSDFKNHKPITTETKSRENKILNNVKLYNKYFDTYKKNYDSENLNKSDEKIFDPNQFKILGKKKQKSKRTKETTKREMERPFWFEINIKEFEELAGDIYNNQDNNDFKLTINNRTYDLKNAKKFRTEVTTRKTTESEAKNCRTN